MKRIFITFDDGRKDNYENSFLILKEAGLKATFFITTGFIDGTFITDGFGKGRAPLSLEELQAMKDAGMEIACHGDRHITDVCDFNVAFQKLQAWGLIGEKCSFSMPNSILDKESFLDFVEKCGSKITSVRGGRDAACYTLLRKASFVTLRVSQTYPAYSFFNKPNIIKDEHRRCPWPSLVIRKEDKLSLLCRFLDNMPQDSSIVLMFHSIVEDPTSTWEWSLSNFKGLVGFLSENTDKMETGIFSDL